MLDTAFENLKGAAKLNVSFWFVLKNVGNGSCRVYYSYENYLLLERSKPLTTQEDFLKLKNILSNTEVVELCIKAPANTKWKNYKLTIVTGFAALLGENLMESEVAVLPEPLFENQSASAQQSRRNSKNQIKANWFSSVL